MAEVKAADVAKLRKMTGAGMMDCKKALAETDGDFQAAVEFLRKKGQKVANKRSDREATEGAVIALTSDDAKNAVMIVLNCETDFVAKNDDFVALAHQIANIALKNLPENLEALKKLAFDDNLSIEDKVTEQIGVIGEKLDLSYFEKISGVYTAAYIHQGNKLASMAVFNQTIENNQVARDVVMQIAAMSPVAIDKDSVEQSVIDKEIEIGKELAMQEGKPAELAEKIAIGKLNKFFKENTLLNQDFVKDNKKTIKQYLSETDKNLTVTEFKRFSLAL